MPGTAFLGVTVILERSTVGAVISILPVVPLTVKLPILKSSKFDSYGNIFISWIYLSFPLTSLRYIKPNFQVPDSSSLFMSI